MAPLAQTLANQANAQLSTGPRTAEGKAASAANSLKDGCTAKTPIVPAGDEPVFAAFREALLSDTHPEGALEEEFFARLLTYGWNLRRARAAESQLLAAVDFEDEAGCARLLCVARYRRDLERSHDRALRELRQLQTQRAVLLQQHNEVIAEFSSIAPLADIARITSHTDPFIHSFNHPLNRPPQSLALSREQARRDVAAGQDESADGAAEVSQNEPNPEADSLANLSAAMCDPRFSDAEKMALLEQYTRPPAQAA